MARDIPVYAHSKINGYTYLLGSKAKKGGTYVGKFVLVTDNETLLNTWQFWGNGQYPQPNYYQIERIRPQN